MCGGDGTSCENSVLLSLAVTDGGLDVYMSNTAPVVGFQFSVSGIDLTGASGGSAADAGFGVTTGPNGAIGFSMTGASIAAGDPSVLLTLDLAGTPTGLSGITISDASGNALDFTYDSGGDGSDGGSHATVSIPPVELPGGMSSLVGPRPPVKIISSIFSFE